jgi:hypothetical protein
MAERFFGSDDPVGKQLLKDKQPYTVKAVFKKDPKFHLQFNYLISSVSRRTTCRTYAKLGMAPVRHICKTEKTNQCKCTANQNFHAYVNRKIKNTRRQWHCRCKHPFFQPLKRCSFDILLILSLTLRQRGNYYLCKCTYHYRDLYFAHCLLQFHKPFNRKNHCNAQKKWRTQSSRAGKRQLVFQFNRRNKCCLFLSAFLFPLRWL